MPIYMSYTEMVLQEKDYLARIEKRENKTAKRVAKKLKTAKDYGDELTSMASRGSTSAESVKQGIKSAADKYNSKKSNIRKGRKIEMEDPDGQALVPHGAGREAPEANPYMTKRAEKLAKRTFKADQQAMKAVNKARAKEEKDDAKLAKRGITRSGKSIVRAYLDS